MRGASGPAGRSRRSGRDSSKGKENPPVWYDDKSKKDGKRKQKAKEGDVFPEETKKTKISKAEAKLKAKLLGANLGFGNFKFKKD